MRRRSSSACSGTRRPSTSIWPSLGVSSPHSMRMVVDLPEPLGPRKPYTCARGTVRSTPSTARSWPKHLLRPRPPMAMASVAAACIAEIHPPPQPCRQLAGALAFQLDLGQVAQADGVLAGQRVVRSEHRFAADHAHPARVAAFAIGAHVHAHRLAHL